MSDWGFSISPLNDFKQLWLMISLSDGRYSHDSSGTFHHPFDIANANVCKKKLKWN
jgi:hypothetical protein